MDGGTVKTISNTQLMLKEMKAIFPPFVCTEFERFIQT